MYSSLVDYVKLSPNCNKPRNKKISKITIHHMAANWTIERCGESFAKPSRRASANYGVGGDGRIGCYVEEENRAWTSSSSANDNVAVTIEVANDGGAPNWHVSDKAIASLIDLCVDICKRNGIKKLNYTGDKTGNLTEHNYFSATTCPGPYLKSKLPYIASEVNKRLGVTDVEKPTQTSAPNTSEPKFNAGDVVKIVGNTYYNGKAVPPWIKNLTWVVDFVSGDRVVINKSANGKHAINSPVKATDLKLVESAEPKKSIEEIAKEVLAGKWGNGLSRKNELVKAGYSYEEVQNKVNELKNAKNSDELKVGDVVKLSKDARVYGTNTRFSAWIYLSRLYVREIKGSRVVVSTVKVGAVTGAVDKKFLIKV